MRWLLGLAGACVPDFQVPCFTWRLGTGTDVYIASPSIARLFLFLVETTENPMQPLLGEFRSAWHPAQVAHCAGGYESSAVKFFLKRKWASPRSLSPSTRSPC